MKSEDILNLYSENANLIFRNKRDVLTSLFHPFYQRENLQEILKKEYSKFSIDGDTRLGHAKTRVCIPVYNAGEGRVSVLKTSHHKDLKRDYQYPAHDVALSTAAAPLYFKPHSFSFIKKGQTHKEDIINYIDGGVFANNPTLIGLLEAIETLRIPIEKIKILSIGTGTKVFRERSMSKRWGVFYWANPKGPKIIDLYSSSQSDDIANTVKYLNQGVGLNNSKKFYYKRIQFEFKENENIGLDETNPEKLNLLIQKAEEAVKKYGDDIIKEFCSDRITPYTPIHKL